MAQRNKVGKHATLVHKDTSTGMMVVKYHQTNVVAWNEQCIILDSNSWRTVTTKTRMNQVANQFGLGYAVFQKDFVWYVGYKNQVVPFKDDMILKR